jgi:hypothetical protein
MPMMSALIAQKRTITGIQSLRHAQFALLRDTGMFKKEHVIVALTIITMTSQLKNVSAVLQD